MLDELGITRLDRGMATPKYLLVEARLGRPLADYLQEHRQAGDSLERIAKQIWADTGVDVTAMTISNWLEQDATEGAA